MFLCLVILSVAAVCDVYSGRIPREVTCFGMLISQAWVLYHASVRDGLISLISSLGLVLILFPLFMTGTLGAGDIKLLMILPAYMSFSESLCSVFCSFVAGALIGLVRMATGRTLMKRLRVMKTYIEDYLITGKPAVYDIPASEAGGTLKGHQIHFTIPILIGTVINLGGLINL